MEEAESLARSLTALERRGAAAADFLERYQLRAEEAAALQVRGLLWVW